MSVDESDDVAMLAYAPANRRARAWNWRRVAGLVLLAAAVGGGGYWIKRARDRATAQLNRCLANLPQIAQSAHIYALDSGEFPPDFNPLQCTFGGDHLIPRFKCPATNAAIGDLNACYVQIPGQGPNSDPRNVLVYEKRGHHRGDAANVVFVDAHSAPIYGYDNVLRLVKETEGRLKAAATQGAGSAK